MVEGNQPDITPLAFFENWQTAGHMYQNYPGIDSAFEKAAMGLLRRPFLRWIGFPLYFGVVNQGYALRLDNQVAGVIYLQFRKMVAHVNDIEVNRRYQGRGLSHYLLKFAEEKAHEQRKRFMTLVVTVTNTRALQLYQNTGYIEQHYHYYYLPPRLENRPSKSATPGGSDKITLRPLPRGQANRNLQKFFRQEIQLAEPLTGEVWEALYVPRLPERGRGVSYAIYWGSETQPGGHVDFFDWGGYGRWRLYTDSQYWGTPDEQALFELLGNYNQVRGSGGLGIMLGSGAHHTEAQPIAQNLGFMERHRERVLMIKPI